MRRRLDRIALAALLASLAALAGAGGASATILEVGGVPKTEKVEITAVAQGQLLFTGTTGEMWGPYSNICTGSHTNGATVSPFTGTKVKGAISTLSFTNCEFPVTVHKPGQLYVEHIPGTTNGTVVSEGAEVTVTTRLMGIVNCKTGAGFDIGTLTGNASGHATMDINAVLMCGFLAPSVTWRGSYSITSPTGLGVVK